MGATSPISRKISSEKKWWLALLGATALNCLFQIERFWRFRAHEISLDGINYIGLARHLVDGDLKASLHAYWSPLTSWLIAGGAALTKNFTLVGKLVTLGSFLASLALLYVLTLQLWRSRTAAALAMFWFSMARGIIFLAAGFVVADFSLTACVLLYFLALLAVLRHNRPWGWVLLGALHALAFLAKAIAMPWLSCLTVLAALLKNIRSPKRLTAALLLAFLFPAAVWLGWGYALKTKYGVFTTGYQLRSNLLLDWQRRLSHYPRGNNLEFRDTSSDYDKYMVAERQWDEVRRFRLWNRALIPMIVDSEFEYLPQAVKETSILLTPAGVLAALLMPVLLLRDRARYRAESEFAVIAILATLCLIAAYCALFFDGRYVIPVAPVLIALCCPLLLPPGFAGSAPLPSAWVWKTLLGLFVASITFFAVYWASSLRTVDRDFAAGCFRAAAALHNRQSTGTLASLGNGPYPDHGVGFEAASYVAYMAGWRVVGEIDALPEAAPQADKLVQQALDTHSDAISVWGSPANPIYVRIVSEVGQQMADSSKIVDPHLGEVGTLLLRSQP
jgi:4-amino-4-deoxy-L-arabinose transferase-like glycosyltransferase